MAHRDLWLTEGPGLNSGCPLEGTVAQLLGSKDLSAQKEEAGDRFGDPEFGPVGNARIWTPPLAQEVWDG